MSQVLNGVDLTAILDEVVDWRYKGFPSTADRVTVGTVGEQGWNALEGDLPFPLVLIKESALDHNIALMAGYCRDHGVSLAPHGKTPIAPQIVQRQLDAGAWGITSATIHQSRVFRAFGVQRILLANELIEGTGLGWVAREVTHDPAFEHLFLVDSLEGVAIAEEALSRIEPTRPLKVLVELGVPGGRSGCRTVEAATAVASAVRASTYLQLAGIEGYEGAIGAATLEERIAAVDRFLMELRRLTIQWARSGLFDGLDEIVVSAGGSLFFDRVVEQLGGSWDLTLPVRVLLRSGSYVTHDSDTYEHLSPLADRGSGRERLQPALEAWGMVLSRPEPHLAIVDFGKRDVPYDLRLPMPFALYRSGTVRDIGGQVEVTALNDQHAFVRFHGPSDISVGDRIGCHLSHPCTTFDKWQLLPLVDDAYQVTGAIRTFF